MTVGRIVARWIVPSVVFAATIWFPRYVGTTAFASAVFAAVSVVAIRVVLYVRERGHFRSSFVAVALLCCAVGIAITMFSARSFTLLFLDCSLAISYGVALTSDVSGAEIALAALGVAAFSIAANVEGVVIRIASFVVTVLAVLFLQRVRSHRVGRLDRSSPPPKASE